MLKRLTNSLLKHLTGIPTDCKRVGNPGSVQSTAAGHRSLAPATLSKAECQRIVNEFGRAMARIGQAAVSGAESCRPTSDGAARFDRSCLPHSPEIIREAVRILLLYEDDPANIETLHSGLKYLTYFD